jgi:hypothetical protein
MDFRAIIQHVRLIRPRVPKQRNPAPSDTIRYDPYTDHFFKATTKTNWNYGNAATKGVPTRNYDEDPVTKYGTIATAIGLER